jgi:hypothetical protein
MYAVGVGLPTIRKWRQFPAEVAQVLIAVKPVVEYRELNDQITLYLQDVGVRHASFPELVTVV